MLLGHVYSVDVSGIQDTSKLKNKEFLIELTKKSANKGKFKPLEDSVIKFDDGEGVTAFLVLKESHLSVHTWPEYNYLSITLDSCKDQDNSMKTIKELIEAFDYEEIETNITERRVKGV